MIKFMYWWENRKLICQIYYKSILHFIFQGTEGLDQIISIDYLQFKTAELLW